VLDRALLNGHHALVSETPETATSAMRGAAPPRTPAAPPQMDELPHHRGVVHEAGPLVDGVQRCRRCEMAFPLAPSGEGFEVGLMIEHVRMENGERMSGMVGRPSTFPYCDAH
jgi:hypothetical protein